MFGKPGHPNARDLAVRAGETTGAGLWSVAGFVVRHPTTAGVVSLGAVVSPLVTVSGLATTVGATILGLGLSASLDHKARARALSLAESQKSRRRIRRLRNVWAQAMTDASMTKPGLKAAHRRMPRLRDVTPVKSGLQATVDLSPTGATPDQLRAAHRSILSAVGAKTAKITEISPSTARMILHWVDPLARPIRTNALPDPSQPLHVPVGLDEDGQVVEMDPRLSNLVIGASGAGKSCLAWTLLAGLQQQNVPVRVRVMDPKGGQEFGQLETAAYDYERDPTKWAEFVYKIVRALEARQTAMRARGQREHTPTHDEPLEILIVDELLAVVAAQRSKVKVGNNTVNPEDLLTRLLSQGRSAGFSVVALSQDGTKETLGSVRSLFSYATCLRVFEASMVDVVLGTGAARNYPAHLMHPRTTAGIGYMRTMDRGIIRYRAALLSDREINQVVNRLAVQRGRVLVTA